MTNTHLPLPEPLTTNAIDRANSRYNVILYALIALAVTTQLYIFFNSDSAYYLLSMFFDTEVLDKLGKPMIMQLGLQVNLMIHFLAITSLVAWKTVFAKDLSEHLSGEQYSFITTSAKEFNAVEIYVKKIKAIRRKPILNDVDNIKGYIERECKRKAIEDFKEISHVD